MSNSIIRKNKKGLKEQLIKKEENFLRKEKRRKCMILIIGIISILVIALIFVLYFCGGYGF